MPIYIVEFFRSVQSLNTLLGNIKEERFSILKSTGILLTKLNPSHEFQNFVL